MSPPKKVQTDAVVYSDGTVSWVPIFKFDAFCPVRDADEFSCSLYMGSWTYPGHLLDLQNMMDEVDTSTYMPNVHYSLERTLAIRGEVKYECCEETYPGINYRMYFKKS